MLGDECYGKSSSKAVLNRVVRAGQACNYLLLESFSWSFSISLAFPKYMYILSTLLYLLLSLPGMWLFLIPKPT